MTASWEFQEAVSFCDIIGYEVWAKKNGHLKLVTVFEGDYPFIIRNIIATTAMIRSMWMIEPALYAKKPIAQKMIRITAIM